MKNASISKSSNRLSGYIDLESKGAIKRAKLRPGKGYLKSLPLAPHIKGDLLDALIADREEGR